MADQDQNRQALVADGVVTVAEAAEFSGIGRTRLYELMDAGRLAYCKIGKSRRIPRRALVTLLAESLRHRT